MIRSTKVSMVAGMRMLVDVQQRNPLNNRNNTNSDCPVIMFMFSMDRLIRMMFLDLDYGFYTCIDIVIKIVRIACRKIIHKVMNN